MSSEWKNRDVGGMQPNYTDPDYFSIQWHTMNFSNEIKNLGWVDYCTTDKISKLEIDNMALELGLGSSNFVVIWEHPDEADIDGCRIIETDNDALQMCSHVDDARVIHLYASVEELGNKGNQNKYEVVDERNDSDSDGSIEQSDMNDSDFDLKEDDISDDDVLYKQYCDLFEGEKSVPQIENHVAQVSDESVYNDSDELRSCSDDDNDQVGQSSKRPKWPIFNPVNDMNNPEFKVGMIFPTFKLFKEAVKMSAIRTKTQVIFGPNNKQKCKAKCKQENCGWFIWCYLTIPNKNSVQIKSANLNHECSRINKNRHLSASFIAKNYLDNFRADPTWSIENIKATVNRDYGFEVERSKTWRAREIAMKMVHGAEALQISLLQDYATELKKRNPGTTIIFELENQVFKSMYVCIGALKEGFLTCRQLISVDGTWLKGLYGGQLLTAIGIDGDDCIYPIAWVVVQIENKENWKWFLELLVDDLGITNSYHWTFMSGRQKGLIPAIQECFENAEHRFCIRHIYTNFRRRFNTVGLKSLIFVASQSTSVPQYEQVMDAIKIETRSGYDYLTNISPNHWSKSHFRTYPKCDMVLNNLCECFNSMILDARCKGIISMNEIILAKLMKRIQRRRHTLQRAKSEYCPKILKKLEKSKASSTHFSCEWSGGDKYRVIGTSSSYIVDKKERTCTCRKWDLTGIPCAHAVSAIWYHNEQPERYLDVCYKVSLCLETYSHFIVPLPSQEFWEKSSVTPIIPPTLTIKAKKGKPSRKRRLEEEEIAQLLSDGKVRKKGSVMHCSICSSKDHNKSFHKKTTSVATKRPQKLSVRRKGAAQEKCAAEVNLAQDFEEAAEEYAAGVNLAQDFEEAVEEVGLHTEEPHIGSVSGTSQVGSHDQFGTASTFDGLSPLFPSSQMRHVFGDAIDVDEYVPTPEALAERQRIRGKRKSARLMSTFKPPRRSI